MSDPLSIQGTLAETTVPDLFRSLIRNSETGIVSLEAVERHDDIYFNEGKLIFASSTDPDLGLGEVLLRSGEIDLDQYSDATEQLVSSKRIGSVLCELGYLKPDELIRAVERQVSTIILHAMAFRTGSYNIEFRSDFPREIISLHLNTERLVMDGVNKIDHWSLISRGAGRMSRVLAHGPNADSRIFHLDLTEEESHVYALLSEPLAVKKICDRSYLSNFLTCRTIWAMLSVNLLDEVATAQADDRRAAVEDEYALESEVEKHNAAFQGIYAIVEREIGDHIHDFVDRVARNLSPEVLPYLSGVNLLNEGRVDFDQLLNNVISSGTSDRHVIVNSVLTELLYGWVYEIKAEFHGRLDGEIAGIVDNLK